VVNDAGCLGALGRGEGRGEKGAKKAGREVGEGGGLERGELLGRLEKENLFQEINRRRGAGPEIVAGGISFS